MATRRIDLRLEEDVAKQVYAFQYEHKMESPSVAIRALVEIALRDVRELDTAIRRAAWREAVRGGSKKLREKIDAAVADALGVAPQ